MASQATRDTAPEVALRRALHRRGVRFRLHRTDLPGRPDLVLVRCRVAVFVDGCFWHGCPDHFTLPRANRAWWLAKMARNQARDREVGELLVALGWQPVRFWEHVDPEVAADQLLHLWRVHGAPRQTLTSGQD